MSDEKLTLADLRSDVDRLDDSLIELLASRARLVAEIGSIKGADGGPVLRPGREASLLRRLVAEAGPELDGMTVVRIWREIVSSAVRQQGPFSVAISAPEGEPSCWALARAHYGAATPMTAHGGASQGISTVAQEKATVGVVPFPGPDEDKPWWPWIMAEGQPRIVARLPVAPGLVPPEGCASGLALACMAPEPSGSDSSFIAVETARTLSRTRVANDFKKSGFDVLFSATGPHDEAAKHDYFLIEVDGFFNDGASELDALVENFGDDLFHTTVIGTAALPLALKKGPGS
ncbi:MAG: hypothetical protein HN658_07465 [Rhodospirillales bacterium]|nr:hypothetical protein [Rhodospirillales bacterium]